MEVELEGGKKQRKQVGLPTWAGNEAHRTSQNQADHQHPAQGGVLEQGLTSSVSSKIHPLHRPVAPIEFSESPNPAHPPELSHRVRNRSLPCCAQSQAAQFALNEAPAPPR